MADDERLARLTRLRREPPSFRHVVVTERVEVSTRLLRLTFHGDELRDLTVDEPAASVRLLVPSPGSDELVIPDWNGNEFLLPDGVRPVLRTFTPLRVDNEVGRLDLEIVRHAGGAVSSWAETAPTGSPAAISGTGSGYAFPEAADRLIVLADETAIPAVTQLVETAPRDLPLEIHVEIVRADAEIDLAARTGDQVTWCVTDPGQVPGGRLVEVARSIRELPEGTFVWAAGEASAMHAIRDHLFDDLAVERRTATVRGYWKPARRRPVSG